MTPSIAIQQSEWTLPDRGRVGVLCLIATEFALFTIYLVAYAFYIGKSLTGPTPSQVLELPIWPTICLLTSSVTVAIAARALRSNQLRRFKVWTAVTILLGLEFLRQTALEWRHLIADWHLTITTNLFGTTFYSLVGLHASHVVLGLTLLSLMLALGLRGSMYGQARRFELLAWYWHFVDAVWVAVFTVVYVIGR
ncbi:MAG: heme-copper oxidase subunit III [Tepidisphaeraceae bacterium]|jgi:cytochrome c oxidase subunit 3/cytochrome o ubiquinol oxidase subunit 3